MRLVVFADLHLDTAFAWAPPPISRQRREALRNTLVRIIELAEEVDADAVLCGGDLYEHDRFTPDTVSFVQNVLNDAGRPVVLAPGNHDYYGPGSLYVQCAWADNVHVFNEDRLRPLELDDGLTLWGAAHRAPANTDGFLDLDFSSPGNGIHLGLFHGSLRSGLPFEPEGKRPHAPFDLEQIERAGLQHLFAGHFHTPRSDRFLTYPGNPDPLTFGEEGERGAIVANIHPDGTVTSQTHSVAQSMVHDVSVDVTGTSNGWEVRDKVADQVSHLQGCVRVTINGELSPDVDVRMEDLEDVAPHLDVLVPRLGQLHIAYDFALIESEQTARGQFVRDVRAETDLDEDERQRILVTGLRALEGRMDLEVL